MTPKLDIAARKILSQPGDRTAVFRALCGRAGIGRNKAWKWKQSLNAAGYVAPCQDCDGPLENQRLDKRRCGPCKSKHGTGALRARRKAAGTCRSCGTSSQSRTCPDCARAATRARRAAKAGLHEQGKCKLCRKPSPTGYCDTCRQDARARRTRFQPDGICYRCRKPMEDYRAGKRNLCAGCTRQKYAAADTWQGFWRHKCVRCGESGHLPPTCPLSPASTEGAFER